MSLQVMGQQHEEEAFFTMVALIEDRLPQTCVLQVTCSPPAEVAVRPRLAPSAGASSVLGYVQDFAVVCQVSRDLTKPSPNTTASMVSCLYSSGSDSALGYHEQPLRRPSSIDVA